MGFLRKKRRSTLSAASRSELGHSLSLPDLTTPLIDEASWEELPAFAKILPSSSNTIGKYASGGQGKPHTIGLLSTTFDSPAQTEFGALQPRSPDEPITPRQSATVTGVGAAPGAHATGAAYHRNRSPSLISAKGAGSPIAFHRPFRGDNAFSPPMTAPPVPTHIFPQGADFRKSAAGWSLRGRGRDEEGDGFSTIGSVRPNSLAPARRKRGKGRVMQERLNVVVAGGRGSGKTSLIRLLSSGPPKDPSSDIVEAASPATLPSTSTNPPPLSPSATPSSPTSAGPPLPLVPHTLSSPIMNLPFKRLSAPAARLTEPAPTTRLSAYQAIVQQPHLQRALAIRFIDTPGLDVQEDDGPAVHAYIRERGVLALLNMVEGQCEAVLREESKVLRRSTAGADELVHLCLYLIDARRVLHAATPAIEPDWGFQGLFLDDSNPLSPIKSNDTARPVGVTTADMPSVEIRPRIPETDLSTIRNLKKRMTVLPILTHTDALTRDEMASVKQAVRRDMAKAFADEEGAGFGLFGATDDAHEPNSPVVGASPGDNSSAGPNPPTPALTESSVVADQEMPYALFCPSGGSLFRQYVWGEADVWDGEHSDLHKLREAIFEVHTKALKNHTRQVLYERFRTERLLAHRARRGISDEDYV